MLYVILNAQKYSQANFIFNYTNAINVLQETHELWEPILKTWFTKGKNNPRISVIKVEPAEGYYLDNKYGNAIAFVKQLVGAAVGKTLDDFIEGKLKVN